MRQVTVCNGGFMLGRVSSRAADNLSSTSAGSAGSVALMFGAESAQMFGVQPLATATRATRRNQFKSHDIYSFL